MVQAEQDGAESDVPVTVTRSGEERRHRQSHLHLQEEVTQCHTLGEYENLLDWFINYEMVEIPSAFCRVIIIEIYLLSAPPAPCLTALSRLVMIMIRTSSKNGILGSPVTDDKQ